MLTLSFYPSSSSLIHPNIIHPSTHFPFVILSTPHLLTHQSKQSSLPLSIEIFNAREDTVQSSCFVSEVTNWRQAKGKSTGLAHAQRSTQFSTPCLAIKFLKFLFLNSLRCCTFSYNVGGCEENTLKQCLSTAGPGPGTGHWHQLYRAARASPLICHFSFISNFHE